jgi:hypothetical protein
LSEGAKEDIGIFQNIWSAWRDFDPGRFEYEGRGALRSRSRRKHESLKRIMSIASVSVKKNEAHESADAILIAHEALVGLNVI